MTIADTDLTATRKANGKKTKVASSKKSTKKSAQPKVTPAKAKATKQITSDTSLRAADIAKQLDIAPNRARVALRAAGIRAPYTPAQRDQIVSVLKAMAKAH